MGYSDYSDDSSFIVSCLYTLRLNLVLDRMVIDVAVGCASND